MEVNVNIQCKELAEALSGLANALTELGCVLGQKTSQTTEPDAAKRKRTKKSAEPEKPADVVYEVVADSPAAAVFAEEIATSEPEPEQTRTDSAESAPAPTEKPSAPSVTLDQITTAGAKLLDADVKNMQKLIDLLAKYGVQAITMLKPDQLDGFASDLRALGAEV